MRIKTSVSLSEEILVQVAHLTAERERSEFIEKALWKYVQMLQSQERDRKDIIKINQVAQSLNEEALDVLGYQDLD